MKKFYNKLNTYALEASSLRFRQSSKCRFMFRSGMKTLHTGHSCITQFFSGLEQLRLEGEKNILGIRTLSLADCV